MSNGSKFCLIGIPDHIGVVHVGGRLGSAQGPQAFRHLFYRLHGHFHPTEVIQDLGDVPGLDSNIDQNHQKVIEFVSKKHNGRSLIVGGSHDHGYSHLAGVLKALQKKNPNVRLGCINIDAHLDVRKPNPNITSGSPFYLALESGVLSPERFIEFGIQSHCNAPQLWQYISHKAVKVIPFADLRRGQAPLLFKTALNDLSAVSDCIVISLDLDAAAQAFSPGVSAPQAEGFTSTDIIEFMEICGSHKKVQSLGIFELNPTHDIDHLSARLAATAAFHWIQMGIQVGIAAGI